jgi:putative toxin-antitoxin system antitoxin component (TIGR02293 family)
MNANTSRVKGKGQRTQTNLGILRRDIAKRIKKHGVVALAAESPLKRIDMVRAGLPALVLDETAAVLGIAKSALTKATGIPVSTAGAQQRSGKPLSPEHSEKIVRVLRATRRAEEVFGNEQEGRAWLIGNVPAFGGHPPLDLLDTHDGYELVMNELERIVFGAPA